MTSLVDLARDWGTDKALYYAPFYDELLSARRDKVHRVLELGIGHPDLMQGYIEKLGRGPDFKYIRGASLFMWQAYFRKATRIVGLDIEPQTMFQTGRIYTHLVDQRSDDSFRDVIPKLGKNFDLIVEDGLHEPNAQMCALRNLMPLLADSGIYIMEDVCAEHVSWLLGQIEYPCKLKEFGEARVIVVRQPHIC